LGYHAGVLVDRMDCPSVPTKLSVQRTQISSRNDDPGLTMLSKGVDWERQLKSVTVAWKIVTTRSQILGAFATSQGV